KGAHHLSNAQTALASSENRDEILRPMRRCCAEKPFDSAKYGLVSSPVGVLSLINRLFTEHPRFSNNPDRAFVKIRSGRRSTTLQPVLNRVRRLPILVCDQTEPVEGKGTGDS